MNIDKNYFYKHRKVKIVKEIARNRFLHVNLATKIIVSKKYRKPKYKEKIFEIDNA